MLNSEPLLLATHHKSYGLPPFELDARIRSTIPVFRRNVLIVSQASLKTIEASSMCFFNNKMEIIFLRIKFICFSNFQNCYIIQKALLKGITDHFISKIILSVLCYLANFICLKLTSVDGKGSSDYVIIRLMFLVSLCSKVITISSFRCTFICAIFEIKLNKWLKSSRLLTVSKVITAFRYINTL